jgi:hypothetical protein
MLNVDKIYLWKNGEQWGPYAISQVQGMWNSGTITTDMLYWCEGMSQGRPVAEIMSDIKNPMPEPPPIPAETDHGQATTSEPPPIPGAATFHPQINWIPALVLYCISVAVSIIIKVVGLGGDEDTSSSIALAGLPLIVLAVVFMSILHYKCWSALPERFRFTSPGKAVGYIFIPFYNFYWAFVTWPKMAEGLMQWQKSAGVVPNPNVSGLAITYAIIFICASTIGLYPPVGLLINIADVVIFILFYKQVVEAMNGLIKSGRM